MSREFIETRLTGYDGPVHVSTSAFQDSLKGRVNNGLFYEKACERVPGFIGELRPTTEDGYFWFWGYHFTTRTGEVAVLIPWSSDSERRDGDRSDRAVAVYTKGVVFEEEIAAILQRFSDAFRIVSIVQQFDDAFRAVS